MHKFIRSSAPVNFKQVEQKYKRWNRDFIESEEHAIIGSALYEQQEYYCAYCEMKIKEVLHGGHIEHLERRNDNPRRTFDWNNMFFSCNNHDSCGKFKDNEKLSYNINDIVDPSREDPADFFVFDALGNILPLNHSVEHRATETIRVFNLQDSARLKQKRAEIAETVKYFLESSPSENDITEFLASLADQDCISVYYNMLNRRMA